MKSKPRRHNYSVDNSKAEADKILSLMFTQAKAQFGDAVKSF